MVTAGYINEEPLRKLCEVIDVIKVDFKGYNKDFYSTYFVLFSQYTPVFIIY